MTMAGTHTQAFVYLGEGWGEEGFAFLPISVWKYEKEWLTSTSEALSGLVLSCEPGV